MTGSGHKAEELDAQSLVEIAQRHRTILQTAMDGFWMVDLQGQLLEVNESYCRMSGYSQQELLTMRILDLEAVENAADTAAHVKKIILQGEDRFASRHRRKDGNVFDVEVSAKYHQVEGGRMVAFLRDITERKATEHALSESLEKFAKAFNSSNDSININRLSDGKYIEINEGFTRITGFTLADVIGRSSLPGDLGIWVNKEDRDRMVAQLKTTGAVIGFEAPFRRKDGQPIIGAMSARIIEINGEACVLTTTRDITEQKRAEEELKQSRNRYRELVELAVDGILLGSHEGFITEANSCFCAMTGMRHEDLMGKHISEILFTPDSLRKSPLRFDLLREGKTVINERIIRRADGVEIAVEMRTKMMPDKTYQSIYRDVTERKRAEERERALMAQLERAARMESLGVLAGGVAHDLNNVLSPIVVLPGMVIEYVERRGDPSDPDYEPTVKSLQTMKAAALRAVGVVSDLVVMGRRGQFQHAPVDVNRVVEQLMDSKQVRTMLVLRPDVQVSKQLSDKSLWCLGSESRLLRVLANLVGNAAEAIEGKGDVVVRTSRELFAEARHGYEEVPAGDYVTIEVTDTGCGMDAKTLARIFEPFFSSKAPSERSGSGLGLSVVHGLVKDHAGFIDVKTVQGGGTTFMVYLPAVAAGAVDVVVDEGPLPGGHERILVVDDEPDQQFLSQRQLKRLGYDVKVASRGEDAVALFESASRDGKPSPFDLVLMDMLMKGIDGISACRSIQRLYPNQKLVILSGYAPEKYEKQVESLGLDCLTKPCQDAVLARAVRSRLDA